jgi:hypothetical protein
MNRLQIVAAVALVAALAGCHDPKTQVPNRDNFTAALNDYLAQRGHLCVARYDWPVVVTDADAQAHSLDAQQMPYLEKLGLAASRDTRVTRQSGTLAAREYALTAEGRKYFLDVPVVVSTPTQRVVHPGDLCIARLSLYRLFGWEKPQVIDGRTVTSLLFSYQVVDPAPWLQSPDARRAFPMAMRAIDNAGTLQVRIGVHLTPDGWVADELTS